MGMERVTIEQINTYSIQYKPKKTNGTVTDLEH